MGEDQIKVTFADVAGVEEAKEEVSELVEFYATRVSFKNWRQNSARRVNGGFSGNR